MADSNNLFSLASAAPETISNLWIKITHQSTQVLLYFYMVTPMWSFWSDQKVGQNNISGATGSFQTDDRRPGRLTKMSAQHPVKIIQIIQCVNRGNGQHPLDVLHLLKKYLQKVNQASETSSEVMCLTTGSCFMLFVAHWRHQVDPLGPTP